MITPSDGKGNGTELFQYDGPSPFVSRRPKTAAVGGHNHRYRSGPPPRQPFEKQLDTEIPGPTYVARSALNHQYNEPISQNVPVLFDMSQPADTFNNDNSHHNGYHHNESQLRWPSLVSLPSALGETLKKGTHLISESWRDLKHISHLDNVSFPGQSATSNASPSLGGCPAPGTPSTLVYDCLMSELRDAMRVAEKRKDQREAEARKAKNLPDYSWLMDPTMRERRRYKMPHDEANQVNALCWRIEAEDCNHVLRRFRESLDTGERELDPQDVPKCFMKIVDDVIADREQLRAQRKLQEQQQHHHLQQQMRTQSMADFGHNEQQAQQSWSEWLHEKFTGSMLNLSSITGYGGLAAGGGETQQQQPPRTASNRVAPTPMTTIPQGTITDMNIVNEENGDEENTPVHHHGQLFRGDSVQTQDSSVNYFSDSGKNNNNPLNFQHQQQRPEYVQQNSTQPLQPSQRNASSVSLYSSDSSVDCWARPMDLNSARALHRGISTPAAVANFSQLNPAALFQHEQMLTGNPAQHIADEEDADKEKGRSKLRRDSTFSSEDEAHPNMGAHDDESRQEYGGGWNSAHDNVAVVARTVEHNERRPQVTVVAASTNNNNNTPSYYN